MSLTLSIRRPTPPALHVLVVEDSGLIRSILRELPGGSGGCEVVGEEVTAAGAITGFRKPLPEVVLFDLKRKTGRRYYSAMARSCNAANRQIPGCATREDWFSVTFRQSPATIFAVVP